MLWERIPQVYYNSYTSMIVVCHVLLCKYFSLERVKLNVIFRTLTYCVATLLHGVNSIFKKNTLNIIINILMYGMVWYGNILFDIVHNIIENILPKHKNM